MKYGNYQHDVIRPLWGYPGSKMKAVDLIYPYLKDHKKIVSPFLGAGSLELNLAYKGHEVIGYDFSSDIANLWSQVLKRPKELSEKIHSLVKEIRDFDKEEYKNAYKQLHNNYFDKNAYSEPQEKAAVYWILQQTAFSCIVETGTPSDTYCSKLSNNVLKKMYYFTPYDFEFGGNYSFEVTLDKHKNDFIYLDPPYFGEKYKKQPLYGTKRNPELHSNFDHKGLSEILNKRGNWVMSYNDCEEIRAMYAGHEIKKMEWTHTIGNSKSNSESKTEEILILSKPAKN